LNGVPVLAHPARWTTTRAAAAGRGRARLVVFADATSLASVALVEAALHAARDRRAIEVVAVVDAACSSPSFTSRRPFLAALIRHAFDHRQARRAGRTLRSVCRRFRVPIVVPPGRRVNAPAFVEPLRTDLRPTCALSLLCPQIFSSELLAACKRPVNYHYGLLPAYRGLRATSWSVYRGDATTGFAYHHMTEGIDEGPVLLKGALPVRPGATSVELGWEKTRLAAARMADVLDSMVAADPGRPQQGTPGYFSRSDLSAVTGIAEPRALTEDELQRRLRAFGLLRLELPGASYPVTRLRRVGPRRARRPALAFTTRDGIAMEPDRLRYLPVPLYRCYVALGGRAC
jgi:methionyl-tRNA formyltransferase